MELSNRYAGSTSSALERLQEFHGSWVGDRRMVLFSADAGADRAPREETSEAGRGNGVYAQHGKSRRLDNANDLQPPLPIGSNHLKKSKLNCAAFGVGLRSRARFRTRGGLLLDRFEPSGF